MAVLMLLQYRVDLSPCHSHDRPIDLYADRRRAESGHDCIMKSEYLQFINEL